MMKTNFFFKVLSCLILLSSEIFACTLAEGSKVNIIEENQNKALEYFAISFILFALTTFLYFKKKKKGILLVIICFIIVGLTLLTSDASGGDCGYTAVEFSKQGTLITFICFSLQFFTWLFKRKMAKVQLS